MGSTNTQLARAMARLGEEFGADVLLSVEERQQLDRKTRIKLRYQALEHTQWAWNDTTDPVKLLVIYDFAMGPERATWTSASAKLLRRTLVQGGIDISDCAFCCMWDCTADVMRVTKADLAEAATRVRDVVRAADTDRVLIMGGNAGQAWNPTGDLTRLWGGTYLWPGLGQVFVRPVMLPGAVFRETVPEKVWRGQIHGFIQEADENLGLRNLRRQCIVCNETVSLYDPFGVATCPAHAAMVIPGVVTKRPRRKQRETLQLECRENDT